MIENGDKSNCNSSKINLLKLVFSSILIFLIISQHSLCQEEVTIDPMIYDLLPVKKISTFKEMNDLISDSETSYFFYYYTVNSKNSFFGAKFLDQIREKLEYLAEIVLIDCLESEFKSYKVCHKPESVKDGFPRMVMLVPPKLKENPYTKVKNNYTEIPYKSQEVSGMSIYRFITNNIQDYSIMLNNDNIDSFLNDYNYNKILLFTDKEKTPLLFRGLSSYFFDRLKFGMVKKDQQDILNRFKIRSFPTLLLYTTQINYTPIYEPLIDSYSGETKAKLLVESLEPKSLKEKLSATMKRLSRNEYHNLRYNLTYLDDNLEAEYFYTRHNNRPSIAVIRGLKSDNSLYSPNEDEILKLSKSASGFLNFVFINCNHTVNDKFLIKYFNMTCPYDETQYFLIKPNPEEKDLFKIFENKVQKLKNSLSKIEDTIRYYYPSKVKDVLNQEFDEVIRGVRMRNRIPFVLFYEDVILLI